MVELTKREKVKWLMRVCDDKQDKNMCAMVKCSDCSTSKEYKELSGMRIEEVDIYEQES